MFFISPWIVGFIIFTAYPLIASAYYSLCDYDVLTKPVFIGLSNYQEMFSDSVFWQSLFNTLIYAAFAIPIGLITSLFFAILLNSNIKGKSIYRTIYFLPSLIPIVASSMVWLWIFNGKYGLVNYGLSLIGITGPEWITNALWTKPALILMSVWSIGNTIVIYLAGLQDVPRQLYEAADIDGASFFVKLRHITIPIISPVIYFNLIMAIIGAFQTFVVPFIMFSPSGSGGVNRSALFFTMYLYNNAFTYNRMGYASAMAWIMFIIILGLTVFATRATRKHIYYGG